MNGLGGGFGLKNRGETLRNSVFSGVLGCYPGKDGNERVYTSVMTLTSPR